MTDWIPRKKRKKFPPPWLKYIFVLIAVCSIAILGFLLQEYLTKLESNKPVQRKNELKAALTSASIDSVIMTVVTSFDLQPDYLQKKSAANAANLEYILRWPINLPRFWLLKKFQSTCNEIGELICEGTENRNGKIETINIKYGKKTLANISIVDEPKGIFLGTISFAIDDLTKIRMESIIRLLETGLPFGYFLRLDGVPDVSLAKALKQGRCECYLVIPTDLESWDTILKSRKMRLPKGSVPDEGIVRTVVDKIPQVKGFVLVSKSNQDRQLLRSIVAAAEKLDLVYLYDANASPTFADSLAFAAGLTILRLGDLIDVKNDLSLAKADILDRVNQFSIKEKGCFLLGGGSGTVDFLAQLASDLKKLNLKVAQPTANMKPVEKL